MSTLTQTANPLAQAQQLVAAQRHLEALEVLEGARKQQPNHTGMLQMLAQTYATLRRYGDAAKALKAALPSKPQPQELATLAHWQDQSGNLEGALKTYRRIKGLGHKQADIHILMAGALMARARRPDALEHVNKALDIDANNASLRLFMAKNHLSDFAAEEQASWLSDFISGPKFESLDAQDKARLRFAHGLVLERTGEHAQAFDAISRANELTAKTINPQLEQQVEQVALAITNHFSKPTLAQLAPAGNPSQAPVFITGLPRSGTTLADQMVASHPQGASCGELELLPHLKQSFTSLKAADIARASNAYLTATSAICPDAQRIVDKSISGALNIGLLLLLFPKARIVVMRRHPMDVFWSTYREMFGTGANTYSYDAGMLMRRIQLVEELTDEWCKRFPDNILPLNYETLARNPERKARKLIAHCGLQWDEACLSFNTSGNVVRTASMAQVRESVNTGSIGRWRNYESQLAPVSNAMAGLITAHEARLEADTK